MGGASLSLFTSVGCGQKLSLGGKQVLFAPFGPKWTLCTQPRKPRLRIGFECRQHRDGLEDLGSGILLL